MGAARRVSEPLQVERLDNGDRMLLRDLVIDLDEDLRLGDGTFEGFSRSADGTTVITVPKGFTTDFSLIPAFARALYRFTRRAPTSARSRIRRPVAGVATSRSPGAGKLSAVKDGSTSML